MLRIGNSSFTPDLAPTGAKGSPAAPSGDGTGTQATDQVELSEATASILQERSERIAALRSVVVSPDYSPSSLPISRKLVSEALSRAD